MEILSAGCDAGRNSAVVEQAQYLLDAARPALAGGDPYLAGRVDVQGEATAAAQYRMPLGPAIRVQAIDLANGGLEFKRHVGRP